MPGRERPTLALAALGRFERYVEVEGAFGIASARCGDGAEAGISAQGGVHGGDEGGAEGLLKAFVPGEAVVVARVVVREFSRQM